MNDLGDNPDFVLTKPSRNPLRANYFFFFIFVFFKLFADCFICVLISLERVNLIQNTLLLLACCLLLERFSIECHITKTKAMTTANEKIGKYI